MPVRGDINAILPIVLVGSPFFYFAVCFISSHSSGWATLARKYAGRGEFHGKVWKWQFVVMRRLNKMYVNVGADQQHLWLAASFLRFCHPPLRIPWDQISFEKVFLVDQYWFCLGLDRELQLPLWLKATLVERLRAGADQAISSKINLCGKASADSNTW